MQVFLSCVLSVALFTIQGQEPKTSPPPQPSGQGQNVAASDTKPPLAFGLEDGTPVKLRISRTVSSEDAQVGDTVDFEVLEEIKSHDVVLVPRGGIAWATVTEAQSKRRMGRAGKLNINIDNMKLADGEKVPLRAVKEVKGGSHVGAMTGAMVATAIVFFPAAPLFLFMKGKDITIPKGTEVTAFVEGDMKLDMAKFSTAPTAAAAPVNAMASVMVESNVQGADIEVDGNFVGSTPSAVTVAPGSHVIAVKKKG